MERLKFNALSEEAKKVAVVDVQNREESHDTWWDEAERIGEDLVNEIREYHELDCDDEIPWEDNYGLYIDLSSISMTEKFYKKVLTEDEILTMGDLDEISDYGLEVITFDGDTDYEIAADYTDVNPVTAIEFIKEYGSEDDKAKIAFISLFSEDEDYEDLLDEHAELIARTIEPLAIKMTEALTEKVDLKMAEVRDSLYTTLRDAIDYCYSYDYYYDYLENGYNHLEEKYRFDVNGHVVEIDGVPIEEESESQEEIGQLTLF